MHSHDTLPPDQTPEQRLLDLLPLLAENLTPQLGYRLELSDLTVGTEYHRVFSNLAGHDLGTTARFVYTYNALNNEMDLESIRFGLAKNVQDADRTIADSVYLQRYRSGFVQTLGLGDETLAETAFSAQFVPTGSIRQVLEPINLFTLRRPTDTTQDFAETLSRSDHWTVREQQTVPLPADSSLIQHQLVIVRSRGITYMGKGERPLYNDDYELTFQSIAPPDAAHYRTIDEETLNIRHNDDGIPIFSGRNASYSRYDHPFVIGEPELADEFVVSKDVDRQDIANFLRLLEQEYMA